MFDAASDGTLLSAGVDDVLAAPPLKGSKLSLEIEDDIELAGGVECGEDNELVMVIDGLPDENTSTSVPEVETKRLLVVIGVIDVVSLIRNRKLPLVNAIDWSKEE